MGRLDALPVGPLLAAGGLGVIGAAGYRAVVAETIDPVLVVGLAPIFLAGGLLLSLGYRVHAYPGGTGRVLTWALVGAVGVGAAADLVLLRTRVFEAELEPPLVLLAVGSVAGAGGAIAAFLQVRKEAELGSLQPRTLRAEASIRGAHGFVLARLDPEGFIEEWSAGAVEVTGYEPEDVVDSRMDVLYPEDADRDPKQDLQRAIRADGVDLEGRFRRADGDTFYGAGTLSAVTHGESLLGYTLVIADRSDERAHIEELERRNEQLEAFASVVSHDLRNPLNVAIGNIARARTREDPGEQLETAESAIERMEQLIEDLLALARQGEDVEEFERVELEETVKLAWSTVDEMWAELEYDGLRAVTADGDRLRQLFENLFRNAVEHGGEDVTVRVGTLGDDGFYIEDDGPGIPDHKREEIFEAGYTTGDEGTGLGLAIVRSIAEAHGWDIAAAEGSDGGARFEIRGVQTLADVEQ